MLVFVATISQSVRRVDGAADDERAGGDEGHQAIAAAESVLKQCVILLTGHGRVARQSPDRATCAAELVNNVSHCEDHARLTRAAPGRAAAAGLPGLRRRAAAHRRGGGCDSRARPRGGLHRARGALHRARRRLGRRARLGCATCRCLARGAWSRSACTAASPAWPATPRWSALLRRTILTRCYLILAPRLDRDAQSAEWVRDRGGRWAAGCRCGRWTRSAWWPGSGAAAASSVSRPTREALELLAARTEGNLLAAHQELTKLTLLAQGQRITAEAVLASVADSARFDVFQLGEAVLAGETRARAAHARRACGPRAPSPRSCCGRSPSRCAMCGARVRRWRPAASLAAARCRGRAGAGAAPRAAACLPRPRAARRAAPTA